MTSPSPQQNMNYRMKRALSIATIIGVAIFIFSMGPVRKEEISIQSVEESKIIEIQEEAPVATILEMPDLDGCTVGPVVEVETSSSSQSKMNKPFWVPSYPNSDNGLFAAFVIGLTGDIGSNAKNYYASSPALKKCFSKSSITITCQQLHPIVGIGPLPESQVEKFQSKIILPIRNPMTAIPEHYQQKAYMYHNAKGQVPIDEWRNFRNEWLMKTVMNEWKSIITTWKDLKGYDGIGLYVPFEHIVDVERGPIVVNEIANILRDAGFPVISEDDDAHCVWYKVTQHLLQSAITDSTKRNIPTQQLLQYPFAIDYIPRYTVIQKQYMITELQSLIHTYPDDLHLISILNEYIQQIQQSINDTE